MSEEIFSYPGVETPVEENKKSLVELAFEVSNFLSEKNPSLASSDKETKEIKETMECIQKNDISLPQKPEKKKYIVVTMEPMTKDPISVCLAEAEPGEDKDEVYESFQTSNNVVFMWELEDLKDLIKDGNLVLPIKVPVVESCPHCETVLEYHGSGEQAMRICPGCGYTAPDY